MRSSVIDDLPDGRSAVSSRVMSLAYVTMHACSTGSSGSVPSARIQTSWPSARTPGSKAGSGGTYRVSIGRGRSIQLPTAASQTDELLVDLLSELLYVTESEDVVACTFVAQGATSTSVELTVGVVPSSQAALHGPPIKAVTYHDLEVERMDEEWRAKVIFDV